jgi:glycosyltransferase involved in cell wall biosynthesis
MSAIRLAILLPYPEGCAPSQRYRFEQWRRYWPADEIVSTIFSFADPKLMSVLHRPGNAAVKAWRLGTATWRRARLLGTLRSFDVVVVHRAAALVGPPLLERALVRRGIPLIYDFDDAIYLLHTSAANRRTGWLKQPSKTAELTRISSEVTVGNRHLADFAHSHNARVTVVPSSVDTDRHLPPATRLEGPVRVGWTGSSTSQQHLESFAPVLGPVLRQLGVQLRVHSDRPPQLPGVAHEWRPWSPSTEVEELAAFDIGIMPTPDDGFSQGKGAMKALLYMATGIPVVASPIPASEDLIRDGENGYLARTGSDWSHALTALVRDPSLRRRIGLAGRATVESGFSARVSARRFAEVVDRVVAG